jgi:hypothetical protein
VSLRGVAEVPLMAGQSLVMTRGYLDLSFTYAILNNTKIGFVPKVCDTENTDLLKKGKKRDLRPTQRHEFCVLRSGATETVASDVSVGRLRSSASTPSLANQ